MSAREYHLIILYYITMDTAKVASITHVIPIYTYTLSDSKGRQNSLSDITIYFKGIGDNGR